MKFTFTCKKVPLNDSVKDYAEKKISKLDRYFPEEAEAFVTFAVEKKNRCVVELTIRSQNGTLFRAQEEDRDGDMRGAIDRALAGYADKKGWRILMERAMNCDNSWGRSANEYIRLYKQILKD